MSLEPYQIRAAEILKRVNGKESVVGAEIGVFCGQLSSALLERRGLFLYMVDSWLPAEKQPERYKACGDWHATLSGQKQEQYYRSAMVVTEFAEKRREVLKCDSTDAANRIPDGALDFVFIDADHSYEGCGNDIKVWQRKIKPGGFLSGHDYANDAFPGFGVTRAVDEFVVANGFDLDLGDNFTWFVRV